jgi:hypothetical protein
LFVCFGGLHIYRGETFKPRAQVIGEDKRAATALYRSQLARIDRLIESRPAGARYGAGLGDGVGQWCIHSSSRHFGAGMVPATAPMSVIGYGE